MHENMNNSKEYNDYNNLFLLIPLKLYLKELKY